MKKSPKLAPGVTGSVITAIKRLRCPRGSRTSSSGRSGSPPTSSRSSVGVDVGGTFTDLVAREASGRLSACKVPTTPAELAQGVLNGLTAVGPGGGPLASVAHGTTVVTNAIVEGRGARVGLITDRKSTRL